MAQIRVSGFGGIIPRVDDKLLPQNCAVDAINCDLRGNGIKSMYGVQLSKTTDYVGTSTDMDLAVSSVQQYQIPAAAVWNQSTPRYAERTLTSPRTIVAGDYLYYAVYMPASPAAVAGQGCIDLLLSSGNTLNAALVDSNAINVKTGNIAAFATGQWHIRKIQIGGLTDSVGGALNGQSITAVRFYQGHSDATLRCARYAFVRVNQTSVGAFSGPGGSGAFSLFDPASGDQVTASMDGVFVEQSVFDDEEFVSMAFIPGGGVPAKNQWARITEIPSSGVDKGRVLISAMGPREPYQGSLGSRAGFSMHGRDCIAYSGGNLSRAPNDSSTGSPPFSGWIYVPTPTAALGSPTVVGGTATDVTRAYVYTRVNEYGMESGPSPAVLKTGKPDGSWNFTGIPTWDGSNNFPVDFIANFEKQKRRVYRTPVGSSFYRLVAELDDNDTALNDAVTDANLGAELPTVGYGEIPSSAFGFSQWGAGLLAAVTGSCEISFSALFQPHAWPIANRYQITQRAMVCESFGDRLFVLTSSFPVAFSGSDPANMLWNEIGSGEACVSARSVLKTGSGVMYCGRTGWGLLNYSGYQNISSMYWTEDQFPSIAGVNTVAMFDRRRLIWITRGATTGYCLEQGAQEKGLVKFQVPDAIYAMGYYDPRGNRWIAYHSGGTSAAKLGKLFGDTSTKLKYTWKSKLIVPPAPVSMAVAKIESSDWATLSTEMKKRGLFVAAAPTAWVTATLYPVDYFVTNGGNTYRCLVQHTSGVFATDLGAGKWILNNSAYTIDITGLSQAESWVYLKIWANADNADTITLVFSDFVSSDAPVSLTDAIKSDCWQFEIRGNIGVTSVTIATSEGELNLQGE